MNEVTARFGVTPTAAATAVAGLREEPGTEGAAASAGPLLVGTFQPVVAFPSLGGARRECDRSHHAACNEQRRL